MKFRLYDLLSNLIPGFVLYLVYLDIIGLPFQKGLIVPVTALAYIIGYFVNTISSWLEGFYFFTWGGKPSSNLLRGKDIWKVRFYQWEKAKSLLLEESGNENSKEDELFQIAMRYSMNPTYPKVSDFNVNYAFSRVILTTTLVITVGYLSLVGFEYINLILFLVLNPIAWYRCKQMGYYFAREVLQTYLKEKT